KTFFSSLLDAKKIHGRNHQIIVDIERKALTYSQLIARSFILGKQIAKETEMGEYVGLMLPNMNLSIVTFFAMQAYNRVPAMMNFSTSGANFIAACQVAKIKTIFTARKFIENAKLQKLVEAAEN